MCVCTRSTGVARDVVWRLGWGGQRPTICGRNSQDTNTNTRMGRGKKQAILSVRVCVCSPSSFAFSRASFVRVHICIIRAYMRKSTELAHMQTLKWRATATDGNALFSHAHSCHAWPRVRYTGHSDLDAKLSRCAEVLVNATIVRMLEWFVCFDCCCNRPD